MRFKQFFSTYRPKIFIYLSLAVVMGGLLLVLFNSVLVIDKSRGQIERMVYNHQHKAWLLSQLRLIANARTNSIQKMLLMNDPISISEELAHFNFLAAK